MLAQKYLSDKAPAQNLYLAVFGELPEFDMEEADLPELLEVLDTLSLREFAIIARWFRFGRVEESHKEARYETFETANGDTALTSDFADNLEPGLITLSAYGSTQRNFQVDNIGETVAAIAESYGVSQTRIRQIMEKALGKLRHPSRSKRIKSLFVPRAELREQIKVLSDEVIALKRRADDLTFELAEVNARHSLHGTESADSERHPYTLSIKELDLSVRAYNCLKCSQWEIGTVRDLISLSRHDIMEIRNLGLKSLEEIESKLKELGLSLKEDSD